MSYELLKQFLDAEEESDVDKIIARNSTLSKHENWKPYGGYHGNFNTIHGQMMNSVAALVEKPVNSIDALLTKECKLAGIDPESPEAPKSIQEGVERFFKIRKGDISELSTEERRKLAESIQIIAIGRKECPMTSTPSFYQSLRSYSL